MRILRIAATLVTGTLMVAGGIALTMTGPAAVVLLGGCTAVVGIAYLYAGLAAEHTHLKIATPQTTRPRTLAASAERPGFSTCRTSKGRDNDRSGCDGSA